MAEETIYKLYECSLPPIAQDNDIKRRQILKETKINLLKEPNFQAPSRAKTAAEFYHLNSKKILTSTFSIQKRQHGSFGLPKTAYKVQRTEDNKILPTMHLQTGELAARQYEFEPSDKTHYKPPVPLVKEGPVQGLSSNLNFIAVNRERAQSLRPPKPKKDIDFLAKPNYGREPGYLARVNETISKEKEYLQMIAQAKAPKAPAVAPLSAEEIQELREALKRRREEINKEYQSITHVSKVYSQTVKRKKEACEKALMKIESDMRLLEKDQILVDKSQ